MEKILQEIYAHLQQHFNRLIYNRGQQLMERGNISEITYFSTKHAFFAIVRSENYFLKDYQVEIYFNANTKTFTHSCTCFLGDYCEHVVATFVQLIRDIKSGKIKLEIDPANHAVTVDFFTFKHLLHLTNMENVEFANKVTTNTKNNLEIHEPGKAEYSCTDSGKNYLVRLENQAFTNQIITSCNCNDTKNDLCKHKTAAFLELAKRYGIYGLFDTHDYSLEYDSILEQIGLTREDSYQEVVQFTFQEGKLTGHVFNDKFIDPKSSQTIQNQLKVSPLDILPEEPENEYMTGYLLSFFHSSYYGDTMGLKALIGKQSKKGDRMIGKLEVTDFPWENKHWIKTADEKDYRIAEHLNASQPSMENLMETGTSIQNYRAIFDLCQEKRVYTHNGDMYSQYIRANDLFPIQFSPDPVRAKGFCSLKGSFVSVIFRYLIGDKEIELDNIYDLSYFFVEQGASFHLWQSAYDYNTTNISRENYEILIAQKQWDAVWNDWLRELANHILFEFDKSFNPIHETMVDKIQSRIYLKEEGNFLLIYPVVAYNKTDVHVLTPGEQFFTTDNQLLPRDRDTEQVLVEQIASTHPSFNPNTFQPFFYMQANKVLEKMWFLDFYELCKRENIEVFGIEKLKQVKYYPARPSINYGIKSGTDWFDIQVQITYDNYQVSLADVRKAIMKKNNYILLDNNKFAMLPEEWIKRFSAAIRFGKVEGEGIRLKKSQFALIHELYDEISDLEVQRELAEKKALLNGHNGIEKIRKPKIIAANMRDYQTEGLNWLCFLYKTNLGGCLADDMGLGKTLQMLALFAWAKGQNPKKKLTNLVVCPTSLIHNWKNEIDKFAPSLNTVLHWGSTRDTNSKTWKKADVVITSYGTLVNDIEWMRKYKFNIATLDESQAIKNAGSLRYKAVNLINTHQRYVMTGTPIENSTVELYAQMNFVNPGILGSLNAFRSDFASSIEKDRDEDKIQQLKQLVSPFIIRRKKEDVAKELPPKTEQVLICEMEEEQRRVYEAFKQDIRSTIMNEIDTSGINKSRFHVLEGLTKLRQICDSPALLNTEEDYGKASVKADELIRYITEKIRDHKALVFSQFLGMLSLIEEQLKQRNIKYVKLTGSSTKRQELVDAFENDESCRVFLISLKAGGVGLNLVSADYVFMVDPWWNPAVENQAIDRTHRIGQTKKVFAYRMICKDTIEEKIMELQKRKKALADDIINSEQGFVSKLTKEDLEQLLS